MAMFTYIGYFNDVDAVMMSDDNADTIVSNMKKGIGTFYKCDDNDVEDESGEYLFANKYAKETTDGNYIVVYDVADRFAHIPLDLVKDNANDEYIDIWKKID